MTLILTITENENGTVSFKFKANGMATVAEAEVIQKMLRAIEKEFGKIGGVEKYMQIGEG